MAYELILTGRVQGVGCRWYCGHVGQRMGIRGAASNRDDGTVQVILATDDRAKAGAYASALKENSFGLTFWGRIERVDLAETGLSVCGDYSW